MSLMNETMTLSSSELTPSSPSSSSDSSDSGQQQPRLFGDESSPPSPLVTRRRLVVEAAPSPLVRSSSSPLVRSSSSPLVGSSLSVESADATDATESVESVDSESNRVRVTFRILRGKTCEVSINRSTTVAEIKAALPALQHVHCKLIKLIHNGKMMGLHQSMDDCGVTDGSIIHVLVLV